MKIISKIKINHFRSIKDAEINNLGQFTSFVGLNNSGKSNILRALNVFFTGKTDTNKTFNYVSDYYRHELKLRQKRKNISISVTFELPKIFKFRKKLEGVKTLLGEKFTLKKEWNRDSINPSYYLNEDSKVLSQEDSSKAEQFLALVNFRYIPNRVMPIDVIRSEDQTFREALIRRLAKRMKSKEDAFEIIKSTADDFVQVLDSGIKTTCSGISGIRLNTPKSWKDMIFSLGYNIINEHVEVEDTAQGSGFQSALMFKTLALIDKDYFQQFGWRQASIWAIEEPESSMHLTLEAQIASYLAQLANDDKNRLQLFATTHSDYILQSSDTPVKVTMDSGTTTLKSGQKKEILEQAISTGITRYTHPIFSNPLNPILLVEGKSDVDFLERAFALLSPNSPIKICCLKTFDEDSESTGGDSATLTYLKTNKHLLPLRVTGAPIGMLFDWDVKRNLVEECKKILGPFTFQYPPETFNPVLNKFFRGIERHMSDRIIEDANARCNVLGKKSTGEWTFTPQEYNNTFKPAVNKIVQNGIKKDDLKYVKDFFLKIISSMN